MALRAFGFLAALTVASLGLATPASAGSTGACSYYDQYGRCYYIAYVVPQYQCGSCGNRGLFTSSWADRAPCGYNPCQPYPTGYYTGYQTGYQSGYRTGYHVGYHTGYKPESVADDDEDDEGGDARRSWHHLRHKHHHDDGVTANARKRAGYGDR